MSEEIKKEDTHSHTIEKRWSVGPGVKQFLMWITFIVTFVLGLTIGWFGARNYYEGEDAKVEVEVLQDDTLVGLELLQQEREKQNELEEKRATRKPNSDCLNIPIRDLYK